MGASKQYVSSMCCVKREVRRRVFFEYLFWLFRESKTQKISKTNTTNTSSLRPLFSRYSTRTRKNFWAVPNNTQNIPLGVSFCQDPENKYSSLRRFCRNTKNMGRRPRRSFVSGARWVRSPSASTDAGAPRLTTLEIPVRPWRAVASSLRKNGCRKSCFSRKSQLFTKNVYVSGQHTR